jgi:hypothetical protein
MVIKLAYKKWKIALDTVQGTVSLQTKIKNSTGRLVKVERTYDVSKTADGEPKISLESCYLFIEGDESITSVKFESDTAIIVDLFTKDDEFIDSIGNWDFADDVELEEEQVLKDVVGTEVYERLEKEYYEPSGTFEYQDRKTGDWYKEDGTPLRNPDEYDDTVEGYTPFGDE